MFAEHTHSAPRPVNACPPTGEGPPTERRRHVYEIESESALSSLLTTVLVSAALAVVVAFAIAIASDANPFE